MKKINESLYCVYVHVNTINGKKYVGITSKSTEERWMNGKGYSGNSHFTSAINKYGWGAFDHIIIDNHLSADDACAMERCLISLYMSNDPNHGYNICCGGETNILPQSSRDKISAKNRGRIISDEVKERRKNNPNPPKAIKVICDGVEFRSITDCAHFYGVSPKAMSLWLEGSRYAPQEFVDMKLSVKGKSVTYEEWYTKRKWVFCDDKEYKSVEEFAKHEGISVDTINGWLYGKYQMREEYKQRGLRRDFKKLYKIIIY